MSNEEFIDYILLSKFATKFCSEKDDITYKQVPLKHCENDFPTLDHNDLMDHAFILYCV